MCDFITWALNDFDLNHEMYQDMKKNEVKLLTDVTIKKNNNNKLIHTLLISQNLLLQNKTKHVRFAPPHLLNSVYKSSSFDDVTIDS